MAEFHIMKAEELVSVTEQILTTKRQSPGALVIALHGDLGAGKTTFTQTLASILHVEESVTSPTFVIMRSYPIKNHEKFTTLDHIDAYRIDDEHELEVIRVQERILEPNHIVCIEWPERVPSYIPEGAIHIFFTLNTDGTRTISIT